MSSYLTFRYVVNPKIGWKEGIIPNYPLVSETECREVQNVDHIDEYLEEYVKNKCDSQTCIFLSGGIDSAILASYLPKGSRAYTIRFDADGAIDESESAKAYAEYCGLNLQIVDVTWEDYIDNEIKLMRNKKSPLHAAEIGLYKASMFAKRDCMKKILLGNGADSTFGGMDKLLSKDWTFKEFVERYSFVNPEQILVKPVPMLEEYDKYRTQDGGIDYISFLKKTHGIGIIQAFDNAINITGCESLEPYEDMIMGHPLDIDRIRSGEPKYMLIELFKKRYPGWNPPKKIPFARPMDKWLSDWEGPVRKEFKEECISELSGDQKYLVYCLERFLGMIG